MDKPKLHYRFHCAATPEKLAKEILRICIEADKGKVEKALREEMAIACDEREGTEETEAEETTAVSENGG